MTDFGTDLSCDASDLTGVDAMVSGNAIVAQALVRRIVTPRGGVIDDPDYGYDVTAPLDSIGDQRSLARTLAMMDAEFRKDERVAYSQTIGKLSGPLAGQTLTTTTTIQTAQGTFTMTTAITNVTATLLGVT